MKKWEREAKQLLKAELMRRGVSYKVLVAKLESIGEKETETSIAAKIYRGSYSMACFLQCMHAIGVKEVSVAPVAAD